MKRLALSAACALCAVLMISGCASTGENDEKAQEASKPDIRLLTEGEDSMKPEVEKMVLATLDGIVKKDYAAYQKNYAPFAVANLTQEIFNKMSAEYIITAGELEKLEYLGSVDKKMFRIFIWRGQFKRSEQCIEYLKQHGKDPASVPHPEMLVEARAGKVGGDLKLFFLSVQ